jgi:hypothetical protein
MKSKFLFAGLLFAGVAQMNAQEEQTITETGFGLQNGAFISTAINPGITHIGYRAGFANTGKEVQGPNNTFVGNQSGIATTSGSENTFVGGLTGTANISGIRNTFIGYQSGMSGSNNTFTGYRSGFSNTASNNTFYGFQSGMNNISASFNTFIGTEAGFTNQAGVQNVFLGYRAGYSNNSGGNNNVFIGFEAGRSNVSGWGHTFVGYRAGTSTIGGASVINNTFVGNSAGQDNTTGRDNIYIGAASGQLAKTAQRNNCLGIETGRINNGYDNIFFGHASGYNNTGAQNTLIGSFCGFNNVGNGNIFLGHMAGYNETGSSKLYIANTNTATPMIYGDFTTGKVGIGGINHSYATPDNFPSMAGSVSVANYKLFVKGGILTEEVRVHLESGWADYVFADDYNLKPLAEVEKFITENGHLPNVPSAQRVKEDGIELGQMANIQQEKIEELTLYAIQQEKKIDEQSKQLEQQQKEIDELKAAVKAIAAKQ